METGLNRGLWLGIGLLMSGCSEPESINDYISQINHAHPQLNLADEPTVLLSFTAAAIPSYQAQTARNPFYWPPELALPTPLSASDGADDVHTPLGMAALNYPPENRADGDCAAVSRPDLVLRATFSEVQGARQAAAALIQVAGSELYTVTLGQQLRISPEHAVVHKSAGNTPQPAQSLGQDLGKVTAITGQSVTLTPNAARVPGCKREPSLVLNLHE